MHVGVAPAGSKAKDLKTRKHMIRNLGWRMFAWEKADHKIRFAISQRILRRFSLPSIFPRYPGKEESEQAVKQVVFKMIRSDRAAVGVI